MFVTRSGVKRKAKLKQLVLGSILTQIAIRRRHNRPRRRPAAGSRQPAARHAMPPTPLAPWDRQATQPNRAFGPQLQTGQQGPRVTQAGTTQPKIFCWTFKQLGHRRNVGSISWIHCPWMSIGLSSGFSLGAKYLYCLIGFGLLSYIFGPLDEHLGWNE